MAFFEDDRYRPKRALDFAQPKYALGNREPRTFFQRAINGISKPAPFRWPAGEESLKGAVSGGMSVDDKRDRAMAGRAPGLQPVTEEDRMRAIQQQEADKQSRILDEILGGMMEEFGGVDRSKIDYGPLDKALKSRMAHLNQVRGQTNQNYDKNDLALEQMHRAVQNEIQTKGRAEFQDIGQDEIRDLGANNQVAQQNLQRIKNEDMAKRAAMLKNLGIEAAGATADPNTQAFSEGQASIARRNDANVTEARGNQASNEAFNQTVATSVGQQGAESRAALTQQLQGILGKLGLVETEYQNDYANQRAQLERQAEGQQYDQFRDRKGFLSDTYGQMREEALQRDQMAQKMATQVPPEIKGFSGLPNDLLMTGFDPQAVSHAMGSLSDLLNSNYMDGIDTNSGYTQTDAILRGLRDRYQVDPMIALQVAKNYTTLGRNNAY